MKRFKVDWFDTLGTTHWWRVFAHLNDARTFLRRLEDKGFAPTIVEVDE